MRVADGLWAIGDVTGVWPLTYMGKYQGRVAAANILGSERVANYDAVPRVVFTDPQAAAVGDPDGRVTATVPLSEVPRSATYTRAYAESPGFMTLVSDGERITGAYALGPDAGEWLQQATVAIRAGVPLEVMEDVIQPFPTFSEIFLHALLELRARVPRMASAHKGTVPLRSWGVESCSIPLLLTCHASPAQRSRPDCSTSSRAATTNDSYIATTTIEGHTSESCEAR